jgi:hypothetical protein
MLGHQHAAGFPTIKQFGSVWHAPQNEWVSFCHFFRNKFSFGPGHAVPILYLSIARILQLLLEIRDSLTHTTHVLVIFPFEIQIYVKSLPSPIKGSFQIVLVIIVTVSDCIVIPFDNVSTTPQWPLFWDSNRVQSIAYDRTWR